MPRTIAIGDIHGCTRALAALLSKVKPARDDLLICLGDYVDKGMDSRGSIDLLIDLATKCRLVPLLGNHDFMMLAARSDRDAYRRWLEFGGIATLDSYGDSGLKCVPARHFEFLESCHRYFETEQHFFVHANYDPDVELAAQSDDKLLWLSLRDSVPGPHLSGKTAVVGHTPQPEVLRLGHLIGIDTGCAYGGKLTAIELISGETWSASES